MANVPKIPNQQSEAELSDFLSKVEEIESVIKGLNSEDEVKRGEYLSKADMLIEKVETDNQKKAEKEKKKKNEDEDLPQTRTGFSKTSINKDAYKNDPPMPANKGPRQQPRNELLDQQAFMATMEEDARERTERRKVAEKVAASLKEAGNAQYKQGNYEKAMDLYNQAIHQVRDSSTLYTNRAQSRIKLGMYTDALSDCDWALRARPNCMKAYVHQGHAYLGMRDYDKARESYKLILTIDSKKEDLVTDYISEVDRMELASQAENKASQMFEDGDESVKNVADLLEKIFKKDQLPLYYSGGFRVITGLLSNVDAQSLFRTSSGLLIPTSHPVLSRYLRSSVVNLSQEERDVLTASIDLLTAACKDNETSQQQLINLPEFANQLASILEVKFKGQGRLLRSSCLNLLHEVSSTPAGRSAIVIQFDLPRLISALFPLMTKAASYASTAASVFNNIALDKRVKAMLRQSIDENILPAFENILGSNKTLWSIISLTASTVTNLATDLTIRNKMAVRSSLWRTLAQLMASCTDSKLYDPLESLLGLAMNISTGVESSSLQELPPGLCSVCYSIIEQSVGTWPDTSPDISPDTSPHISPDTVMVRALAVLSNTVVHCPVAVEYMSDRDRALVILQVIKTEDIDKKKPALKCLVTLTKHSERVRTLVANNKGTSALLTLLSNEEETTIGNAALCLSHIAPVDKVSAKLTKTNIIQKLLTLARDAHHPSVQSNCAILIGKLVQADQRHAQRLQELHGFQILHNCMKYIN